MVLDEIIAVLINQGIKSVWFYQTEDSTGASLFQLLDRFGDELAWRWVSDGTGRWRILSSSLPAHPVLPEDAAEFDLPHGLFQLLTQDATNGSSGQLRPEWCRQEI
ncbi:hypothetical protein [Leclercia adecarboxylata]|uniref:hypothetical protein n=1 Tax=Leclercia adecarboxylata TaxID=83655 RepID=UPI00057A9AEB|nr:hypothetical protein [Leclercia adecarboxylata]